MYLIKKYSENSIIRRHEVTLNLLTLIYRFINEKFPAEILPTRREMCYVGNERDCYINRQLVTLILCVVMSG